MICLLMEKPETPSTEAPALSVSVNLSPSSDKQTLPSWQFKWVSQPTMGQLRLKLMRKTTFTFDEAVDVWFEGWQVEEAGASRMLRDHEDLVFRVDAGRGSWIFAVRRWRRGRTLVHSGRCLSALSR